MIRQVANDYGTLSALDKSAPIERAVLKEARSLKAMDGHGKGQTLQQPAPHERFQRGKSSLVERPHAHVDS